MADEAPRDDVRLTVEQLRTILRHNPDGFYATIDKLVADCNDAGTIHFWIAVKEFAKRSSRRGSTTRSLTRAGIATSSTTCGPSRRACGVTAVTDGNTGMVQPAPRSLAKCDYSAERWAVLSQLSMLVGCIWVTARWATLGGSAIPPLEWEFYIEQLRLAVERNLPTLEAHHHEWRAQPLKLPSYPERAP